MRATKFLAFAVCFVLAAAVQAQAPEKKMKSAPKGGAKAAVIIPAADMKWTDLDPKGAPGVKIADLSGDHTKGAFRAITKFPAGFNTPLHTHTHDMWIVVMSGTFIHGPEGKSEVRLGPGSYLLQPGGNYRHTTKCDPASECTFTIESNGAFDLIPVEAAKK
jgi:anti-sigma factor ChrR (cupin superfamily)